MLNKYFNLSNNNNRPIKSKDELIAILKKIADLIRGKIDYYYILYLIFLKALEDKYKKLYFEKYKELKKQGYSDEEIKEILPELVSSELYGIHIPEEYFWEKIRNLPEEELPQKLSEAFDRILGSNEWLKDLVGKVTFVEFLNNPDFRPILKQIVEELSAIDFSEYSSDILGDAYEWVIGYFARDKQKAGEQFTPREVVRLMVELLDIKLKEGIPTKVFDPAAGSGGMLIHAYYNVKKKYKEKADISLYLYAQEYNPDVYVILKMNAILHGIKNLQTKLGDSLVNPFTEDGKLLKADYVITNPPWNQDGYNEETLKKNPYWREVFKYGFTTKNTADWAWIQLILAMSKEKAAIVLDNGCLFRSGREKTIRKQIVEKDLIEAVILLPEKLFYNTGAPGVIIIFNHNKPPEREGKILFINASQEYEKHPEVRRLNYLSEKNIKKIVETYKEWKEIPGFSRIVSIEEVRKNDYNLNVTLYVFPKIEEEKIDIKQVWNEIEKVNRELEEVEEKIKGWVEEITKIL